MPHTNEHPIDAIQKSAMRDDDVRTAVSLVGEVEKGKKKRERKVPS